MTTGIGAVCLSLPLVLQEAGFLLGLAIIQLTGLVSLMAMHSVAKATQRTGIAEYLEVCEHLLGHTAARVVAVLIVIFTMEHLLLYEVMVARLFFDIFPNLFQYRTSIILYYNILILLQLSLMRNFRALKFVTCLSFIGLGYITLVLGIELPHNPELANVSQIEYAKWGTGIFTGMSICMVSFICPTNVGPVHKELQFATRRRMKKINHMIIAIEQVMYTILAVVGYLSTISSTPEVITERPYTGKSDFLMTLGKAIMCIALIVDIPTFIPHCSSSIETLLHWRETHVLHVPLTALVMFVPVLFTIYNLDLGFLFSLIAAQATWFFYFIPGKL
jgi:amino acid permease